MKFRLIIAVATLAVAAVVFSQGGAVASAPAKPTFAKHVSPFLKKFCVGCHTGANAPDKVDFSKVKTEADAKKYSKWMTEGAHEVAEKKMPPKGMVMPSANESKMFQAWVKANIKK